MNTEGIRFVVEDVELAADDFLKLAQRVWPGNYDRALVEEALRRTVNVTAWDGDRLVGCVRVLTDGYFFGTIPELLVDPDYQGQSIGRGLMERAWVASPTSLYFGAQSGAEGFYEKLGYSVGPKAYSRTKPRHR
jgi:GNAT superfamily N-acetyltransferase